MSGQNTEKQILAMVLLLVLSVASLGAYTWFDNGRRTEARSEILTKDAERAAWTFANNCRECMATTDEAQSRTRHWSDRH